MNKNEKSIICEMIAKWEWNNSSSSSEANAFGICAYDLKNKLKISDDDRELMFYRACEIQKRTSSYHSEENYDAFDAIYDFIEIDFRRACDIIDIHGFDYFVNFAIEELKNEYDTI